MFGLLLFFEGVWNGETHPGRARRVLRSTSVVGLLFILFSPVVCFWFESLGGASRYARSCLGLTAYITVSLMFVE